MTNSPTENGSFFVSKMPSISVPWVTTQPVLAAVFGGLLLGFGVGLVIRNGGSMDGTETEYGCQNGLSRNPFYMMQQGFNN